MRAARLLITALLALCLAVSAGFALDRAIIGETDRALQQIRNGDRSQTLGIPMAYYWIPMLFGATVSIGATLLLALKYALVACHGPARTS